MASLLALKKTSLPFWASPEPTKQFQPNIRQDTFMPDIFVEDENDILQIYVDLMDSLERVNINCSTSGKLVNNLSKIGNEFIDSLSLQSAEEEFGLFNKEVISQMRNTVEHLKHKLEESSKSSESKEEPSEAIDTNASGVKIPEIPTFDGNPDEWISFKDKFTTEVKDNSDLSDSQKYECLKDSVKSEVLQKVYATEDMDYNQVWEKLSNRYRREITTSTLNRLMNYPIMHFESQTAFRQLLDTVNECIRTLRALDAPVDQWDIILSHMVTQKMDKESKEKWECCIYNDEQLPFWMLTNFLEDRSTELCNKPSTPVPEDCYAQDEINRINEENQNYSGLPELLDIMAFYDQETERMNEAAGTYRSLVEVEE